MKGRTNSAPVQINSGGGVLITTIRLDQTISDPNSMITVIEDTGAIATIRKNSHRYLGKCTGDGIMTICQLDDNDSNYYHDGAIADLSGEEGDVFMKLPKFYYRTIEFSNNIWDITFLYGEPYDSSFKEWSGNDLIGVYKAHVNDNKLYSVNSGLAPNRGINMNTFKSYATNRGNGYSLISLKHHNVMAFLFLAYYLNTDAQTICSAGNTTASTITGLTTDIGMTDTISQDVESINFWGLENWWGHLYESMNEYITFSSGKMVVDYGEYTEEFTIGLNSTGYITKIFVNNLNCIPTAISGTSSTGFCDYAYITEKSGYCLRSFTNNLVQAGPFMVNFGNTSAVSNCSTRLAFAGTIIEESSSSVFLTL